MPSGNSRRWPRRGVTTDGNCMTLNRGTTERPQMLYGVRSLTSAAGAASGDIAVVETFDHVSYVIGTVATKSGRSHGIANAGIA